MKAEYEFSRGKRGAARYQALINEALAKSATRSVR
jgi:hypothetical protein